MSECPLITTLGVHSEAWYEGGSCKWCGDQACAFCCQASATTTADDGEGNDEPACKDCHQAVAADMFLDEPPAPLDLRNYALATRATAAGFFCARCGKATAQGSWCCGERPVKRDNTPAARR